MFRLQTPFVSLQIIEGNDGIGVMKPFQRYCHLWIFSEKNKSLTVYEQTSSEGFNK